MSPSQVVLGLDYGGTKIGIAVSDLAADWLASTTIDSRAVEGARASFGSGIRGSCELLTSAAQDAVLAAAGTATFGIPFDDRVELAPAISDWGELAMGRELPSAPACPRPARWTAGPLPTTPGSRSVRRRHELPAVSPAGRWADPPDDRHFALRSEGPPHVAQYRH